MAVSSDGGGYWLSNTVGQVFPFGNAPYYGDTYRSGRALLAPLAATAPELRSSGFAGAVLDLKSSASAAGATLPHGFRASTGTDRAGEQRGLPQRRDAVLQRGHDRRDDRSPRCSTRRTSPSSSSSTTARPTARARSLAAHRRPARPGAAPADQPGQGRGAAAGLRRGDRAVRDRAGRRPRVRPRRVRRRCSQPLLDGQGRRRLRLALPRRRPHRVLYFWHSVGNRCSPRCRTCSPT